MEEIREWRRRDVSNAFIGKCSGKLYVVRMYRDGHLDDNPYFTTDFNGIKYNHETQGKLMDYIKSVHLSHKGGISA